MNSEREATSSVQTMLSVFDVTPNGERGFVGGSDAGGRDVIDASQALSQAIVATAKTLPAKTVRRASGVFCRPIYAGQDIEFTVAVVHEGRLFATSIVTVSQADRICGTITVLQDTVTPDVIRHPTVSPSSTPAEAIPCDMPLTGRELRLVGLADPNDPDEVGPPRIEAWLHYDDVPERDDLRRALLAHFTGHLSISTTMRAHPGIGTAMAHRSLSTGVMAIGITFHDPVDWTGWVLYDHESTAVGAGMSFVRGEIRDEAGRLLASFTQDGLLQPLVESAKSMAVHARL